MNIHTSKDKLKFLLVVTQNGLGITSRALISLLDLFDWLQPEISFCWLTSINVYAK